MAENSLMEAPAVSEQNPDAQPRNTGNEFERAGQEEELSLAAEFILFLKENKKWWLLPIILVLGAVGVIAILGQTGAAPFIYTLF